MKRVQAEKDYLPTEGITAETGPSGLSGAKKRLRLRPVTFTACALLFVLLFGTALHAVGINVWRLIASWDNETMEVRIDIQGKIKERGNKNDPIHACDDAFFQKLKELEIAPLLPSWLPDGFVLERVESKIENDYYRWAVGSYICGDRRYHTSVVKNTVTNAGGISSLEKDEREPDIYERGGTIFYIFDNLSRARAFWVDPPYIINLSGNVSRDEIRQMIDSMFERK